MCFRPVGVGQAKKVCPACKAENPPVAVKCVKCGAPLPAATAQAPGAATGKKVCPACKAENPGAATRCVKCGAPLAAPSGAPQ